MSGVGKIQTIFKTSQNKLKPFTSLSSYRLYICTLISFSLMHLN